MLKLCDEDKMKTTPQNNRKLKVNILLVKMSQRHLKTSVIYYICSFARFPRAAAHHEDTQQTNTHPTAHQVVP